MCTVDSVHGGNASSAAAETIAGVTATEMSIEALEGVLVKGTSLTEQPQSTVQAVCYEET